MTVLLGILKVIGIILLVILAIVLCLILFILLSPIRYESTGSAGPGDIQIRLKISWLMKILRIRGSVTPDRIRVEAKVLFFRVFHKTIPWHYPLMKKSEDEPEKKETEKPEEKTVKPEPKEAEKQNIPKNSAPSEKKSAPSEKKAVPKEMDPPEQSEKKQNSPTAVPPEVHEPKAQPLVQPEPEVKSGEEERESFSADKILDKMEESAEAADRKMEELREKLLALSEKIDKAGAILEEKSTWKTAALVKRSVIRLIRHVLPRQVRVHGRMGTGDPSLTAKILGVFYMGYPLYGDSGDYRLQGDFEQKILKGKYYIKGRIRLVVPALIALRLFLDKNIRRLIFRK